MAGGCWICNPMCGKCQPAPMKAGKCSDCGTTTVFERLVIMSGAKLLCKKCGKDLTAQVVPEVVRCNYSGKLCAYPCGKSKSPKHDHGDLPCERNTPPSDSWLKSHPDKALRRD